MLSHEHMLEYAEQEKVYSLRPSLHRAQMRNIPLAEFAKQVKLRKAAVDSLVLS
jgi:hypothetical protein